MSGEQLIGDAELGLSASEPPGERPETAAISRRPASLLDRSAMERLSWRTNVHGLAYFVGHYALIGLGGWLCWATFPGPLFWPVFAFQAVVTGFLFSPLHECAHGSAFRSRWLNETALWITALVYVVPPYYFRYFHLGHHRFTQVPGKDPSLVLPEPANFGQYLWYCAGLWFWWRNLSWMVKHACGCVHPASATYVPAGRRGLMVIESRIMVLLYAALFAAAAYFGFAWVLIIAWIAPRVAGEPIQRIIRVAEHLGCEESPDLLRNTRTTLTNRFVNAIAWQMPYHAEHHLFPNVPFHALPPRTRSSAIGWWRSRAATWPASGRSSGACSTPIPPPGPETRPDRRCSSRRGATHPCSVKAEWIPACAGLTTLALLPAFPRKRIRDRSGNRPVEASNNQLFRVEEREIHNRARLNVAVGQSDLQFAVDPLPGLAETGVTDAASESG